MGLAENRTEGGTSRVTGVAGLREIAGRAAPVALANTQVLPVLPAIGHLLVAKGLRRGSVVGITGASPGMGATALALALLAGPSGAGSWCAIVGVPGVGGVAASEAGIDLARCAVVPDAGRSWPTVVAALLDALDVVALAAPARVRTGDARRLAARARERGSVLVVLGPWPEATDVRLSVAGATWRGVGRGHGSLSTRRMQVVAGGRGAAARERRVTVELASLDPVKGR